MGSRHIGQVDWPRLGNEQDVGGKGERETMDHPWAPGISKWVDHGVHY